MAQIPITAWNNWPAPTKGLGDARMAAFFAPGGFVSGSGAGAWSSDRYQQVLRYTGWNYIGIKVIAEAIAGLMPNVGSISSVIEPGKRYLNQFLRRKALIAAQEQDEIETAGNGHPLVRLLQNPNTPDTAWTFFYRTVIFLELTGNSYWWKIRNAFGQVIQMYVLPAHWVRAIGGIDELVEAYEVRPFGGYAGAKSAVFPAKDVVHFAYPSALSVIDGWSPNQAGALWTDTAQSIDISRLAAMKQGIKSDLLLALDPSYGNPDDPTMDRFLNKIMSRSAGEINAGKPMVFPGGVKPHTVGRNVAEMDYVDSSNQVARDWLLAIRRVSKTLAGISEDVNFASMNASLASFMQLTIRAKLMMIGQTATEGLAKDFGPSTVVYYPDPTPADPAQTNADIDTDAKYGAITPNEIRRRRGNDPYPKGGDDPILPMGVSPVPWVTGVETAPASDEQVGFDDGIDSPDVGIDDEPVKPEPSANGKPHGRLAELFT